ncbi:hypothetical protein MKX40_22340 [Paenibacillus sp. FSL R5-0517]|uniref:hypothetical protein n=1 Tax=Paenibacillus sp. FSL R5-0517 TaxID=2921647 RepID=UPI0030DDD4D6
MELVYSWKDIKNNMQTFDEYRGSKDYNEYYRKRIEKGICFIVCMDDNGNRNFYPSRFIGYVENSAEKHTDHDDKHGRYTNEIINNILGKTPKQNEQILRYFEEFCGKIDIEYKEHGAAKSPRKFWVYN